MGKLGIMLFTLTFFIMAEESVSLQKKCLECHKIQQIPDKLISKRYLMQYSTQERIEKAMLTYLMFPEKEHSIMPAPFFSKFPMKEHTDIDEMTLEALIHEYVEKFDMQKRLILEKTHNKSK